jgi:hypothetical protein
MRNVQRTASCGASAQDGARGTENCRSNVASDGAVATAVADPAISSCDEEFVFAKGCVSVPVCLDEVAQHVLFAQEPGRQAFSLRALERMQLGAERPSGAAAKMASTAIEIIILFNIALSGSTP